ncbi:uncharacterized protein LOC8079151 isoform X1 [Sorghum bicolor]|nr:uncharacterized protein LOC8079151 isoform X1 [Sorghum bicolor]|eukprot:XP_021316708.1 uncharacterized protein LOC8079151 isoform X1 [Sorghum bicolor]
MARRRPSSTASLTMDLGHDAKEAWDEWEIHCLVLASLSLQVFLSLTADLRQRSASRVLCTLLWLAYLSADTVAVFVLGHLAVHAQAPRHELMLFWAPFMLVHLGGQDSITAFSKQDNELWTRHLLGLVTQTAVAGYVVSKSSWPDIRLRAAMVLMFLCGFFKYSGRTYCLYSASPKIVRASTMAGLWLIQSDLRHGQQASGNRTEVTYAKERFEVMFQADKCWEFIKDQTRFTSEVEDIMLVDTPVDDVLITIKSEELSDIVMEFKDMPDRCVAYQYVAAHLVQSYQWLYTKASLLKIVQDLDSETRADTLLHWLILVPFDLTYNLFQYISTAIALVLFVSAQKEGHHSKADIAVSYILLIGAIVLDLLPAFMSIVSYARKPLRPRSVYECAFFCVSSCIQPQGWRTIKQWSEELAQYSMIRRYTSLRGDHGCMSSIWKWILKCKPLGAWCVEFLDLARTPVSDDLKLFVLDKLLFLETRIQEWDFANFRGQRALGKWMDSHQVPVEEPERSCYAALHKSLSSGVEFPTSVLIWHIATEICYFSGDNGHGIENDETRTTTERKKRSRELSQYIMYLVFKCDVLLTSNSRYLHYRAVERLTEILLDQSATDNLDEKKAAIKVFDAMKEEQMQPLVLQSPEKEALYSLVLHRAHAVAQELTDIDDEADRWHLISEVWLEMFFYTAPRCGPDFHYEHLSTGGEFISHVLLLMRSLGPFMPKPAA